MFHFNSPNQSEDWRTFYTRAVDCLDALDIGIDQADNCHKGWKWLKLMLKGDDREALQTLIDNGTIMEESMKTPHATLDVIRTTIKSDEYLWAHRDELLSNVRQQFSKGIHVLSSTSVSSSPNVGSSMPKPRRCLNSWSCNTKCKTTRPETASASRTSLNSHISPFSPSANCWNLGASSTRKPGRGDELT